MKTVETEFSKELTFLLRKHKKTIESDKSGIFIVDDEIGTNILIAKPETASEDFRDKVLFVRGKALESESQQGKEKEHICPRCESKDIFSVVQVHHKCRGCGLRFCTDPDGNRKNYATLDSEMNQQPERTAEEFLKDKGYSEVIDHPKDGKIYPSFQWSTVCALLTEYRSQPSQITGIIKVLQKEHDEYKKSERENQGKNTELQNYSCGKATGLQVAINLLSDLLSQKEKPGEEKPTDYDIENAANDYAEENKHHHGSAYGKIHGAYKRGAKDMRDNNIYISPSSGKY